MCFSILSCKVCLCIRQENVLEVPNTVPDTLHAFINSGYDCHHYYYCSCFPYSSLGLALAFLILDLYPKITDARKKRKRTSPSVTKESINLRILNWKRKTIVNHKDKEETRQESTGC